MELPDFEANPAKALRAIMESIWPPEMRANDWDQKWASIEAWCEEPANLEEVEL